jgi:hypothetical protein
MRLLCRHILCELYVRLRNKMAHSPKILSQGILDGFCLLYAVLNTYKTFTAPKKSARQFARTTSEKWRKLIRLSPSLEKFSSGTGSVFGLSTTSADIAVISNLINSYFSAIEEHTKSKYHVERVLADEALKTDFSHSMLIFCLRQSASTEHYTGIDHWVCGINIKDSNMLLACS